MTTTSFLAMGPYAAAIIPVLIVALRHRWMLEGGLARIALTFVATVALNALAVTAISVLLALIVVEPFMGVFVIVFTWFLAALGASVVGFALGLLVLLRVNSSIWLAVLSVGLVPCVGRLTFESLTLMMAVIP